MKSPWLSVEEFKYKLEAFEQSGQDVLIVGDNAWKAHEKLQLDLLEAYEKIYKAYEGIYHQ